MGWDFQNGQSISNEFPILNFTWMHIIRLFGALLQKLTQAPREKWKKHGFVVRLWHGGEKTFYEGNIPAPGTYASRMRVDNKTNYDWVELFATIYPINHNQHTQQTDNKKGIHLFTRINHLWNHTTTPQEKHIRTKNITHHSSSTTIHLP